MLRAFYVIVALLMIGGYGYAGWRGLELFPPAKSRVSPQSVRGRHGAGGAYWYGGYRGGK